MRVELKGAVGQTESKQKPRRKLLGDTPAERQRFKVYGITPSEYRELLSRQDFACAVCGSDETLHIDHDHRTGRVRGLLCGGCNRALGILKEDPDRIRGLALYAELHQKVS